MRYVRPLIFLSLVVVEVCLVTGSWGAGLAGSVLPGSYEAPRHINHTFIDPQNQYFSGDEFGFSVVAVGDVVGAREVIIWIRFYNHRNESRMFFPYTSRMKVDEGPWRNAVYNSASRPMEVTFCYGVNYTSGWLDNPLNIGANSSVVCWVVFRLSKSEFESIRQVGIQYWDVYANLSISPWRQPEIIPSLEVLSPRDGQHLTEFKSVQFLVWDSLVTVNWSLELDGETVSRGTLETGNGRCPTHTAVRLSAENGPHQVVVRISEGRYLEAVTVNFVVDSKGALRLLPKWTYNTSDQFGVTFGAGHRGGFTVWDLDGDGVKEVVFATRRGPSRRVWCIEGNGEFRWIYPPLHEEGLLGDPTTKASLVDVDNNEVYELCLIDNGGRLHVLNADGSIIWRWSNPEGGRRMEGAPQTYDVNGDGRVEFFITDDAGNINRISHSGELVWAVPIGEDGPQGPPTIADIDRDGEFEVLWTALNRYVYCVSAKDAAIEWRFDTLSNLSGSPVIVADIDGDEEYEAVTWTSGSPSSVILLTFYGSEIGRWESPHEEHIAYNQAMGDVDGDGRLDLVVMSNTGMYCLDIADSQPFTKWEISLSTWVDEGILPAGATPSHFSSYQLIADIDGDGEEEILWLAPYPIVTDGATGRLEAFYLNEYVAVNRRQESGAWWGDVDGDGISEWICELNGLSHPQTQVYCLTMNGNFPAESPWPEYYHSAYPAEYQNQQDWLTLKAAYSNSLWFPIGEVTAMVPCLSILYGFAVLFLSLAEPTKASAMRAI